MKNIRIGTKMSLGLGLIILLVMINSAAAIRSIMNIEDSIRETQQQYMPLANETGTALSTIGEMATAYLLFRDTGRDEYFNQAVQLVNQVEQGMKNVEK